MRTVALYGGSFDPPHIAHIAIIEALCELTFLDKVVVMPTFLNPFKSKFTAPAKLRLQWLRDIFKNSKKIEINSFEVDLGEKTPTITTVNHLLENYEKVYVVIGADNLASLEKWYHYDELKSKVTFIVATRDDIEVPSNFIKLHIDEKVSSSDLRKKMNIESLPEQKALEIMQYYKENNAN
jgi:nicotinate-nucleotide adenylyltransferase